MHIGEYEYPDLTTFAEALEVADEAYQKYHGLMPAMRVAEKLGYKVKNPASISGFIYRRFDDMALFGLFARERGGIRVTDVGKAALDPYDQSSATRARARLIRNIPLIEKAYSEWKGELPGEEAFPSLVKDLTGVEWKEAKDNSLNLRRLFSECFPYLSNSQVTESSVQGSHSINSARSTLIQAPTTPLLYEASGIYGEVKTIVGSVVLRNAATIKLAHDLLDVLGAEVFSAHERRAQRAP